MGRRRRRHETTAAQQAEVLRRLEAGETYRAVALAVFGGAGAKDRVARIVRRAEEASLEDQLRTESGEVPLVDESLSVEDRVAELERIRGNIERVRRLNEQTREKDEPPPI